MDGSPPSASDTDLLRPARQTRRLATLRAISALILREMVTGYGRSPGGYLWALLEPIGGTALLVAIFSLGFRSPPLGTNFAIFYASGLVPFMMYTSLNGKLAQALNFSKQLLVYPSVTFIDALLARFILEFITQLMVAYIVFSGILLLFDTQTAPYLPGILLAYAMVAALAFGVGVANAFLATMFPVWGRFWAILNRPMLIISGIIFIPESIPEPYRGYMLWNPLVHFVAQMRRSFYPYYDATYVSLPYVFGISFALTAFGLVFLLRYHRDLLNL